jgi:hypothetical protein
MVTMDVKSRALSRAWKLPPPSLNELGYPKYILFVVQKTNPVSYLPDHAELNNEITQNIDM